VSKANVHAVCRTARLSVCRASIALALALASLALVGPVAEASFPGRNGLLAVGRFAPGQAVTIWLVDPRSGRARQLTRVSRRCRAKRERGRGWQDSDPSFSASGRFVAYLHIDFYECDPRTPDGIYVIRADGRGRRRLPVNPDGSNPAFSRSGRLLAFDDSGSIFIRDLKRPPPARELSDPRPSLFRQWSAPSWGASGRLALTVGATTGARGHIATVRPNGSNLRLVTRSARDQQPDWSPQGDRIVFSRVDNPELAFPDVSDILVAPARAHRHQRPKRLTHTRDAFSPAWSPDGREIAFVRTSIGTRFDPLLAIMSARGARQRQLPVDEVDWLGRISWQPLR
jgi:Tol biopolymer transport system component